MFEMARRMLVWDDELYDSQIINDAGSREEMEEGPIPSSSSSPSEQKSSLPSTTTSLPPMPTIAATSLPRWRPSAIRPQTISNVNPSFRTSSPIMTNAGYAGILRRNSRKKNKPSMWRHCLRVYSEMGELENSEAVSGGGSPAGVSAASDADKSKNEENARAKGGQIPGVGTTISPSANPRNSRSGTRRKKILVRRSNAHHEAALVAASKLGMWEEALLIYRGVESSALNGTATVNGPNDGTMRKGKTRITDNMLLSVVSACVKGSKVKRTASSTPIVSNAASDGTDDDVTNPGNTTDGGSTINGRSNMANVNPSPSRPMMRALTIEERRKPLDMARDILLATEEKHDIPLVSRHVNPLASAYNRLGLRSEAAALINGNLEDHVPLPSTKQTASYKKSMYWKEKRGLTTDNEFEAIELVDWSDVDDGDDDDDEDEYEYSHGYEDIQLNVHQMKAKDRASYSLLVQGAAMEGDWTSAVQELQRMTEAGLHPNSRNLNSWNEVLERGCRPSGNGDKDESDSDGAYYYGGRQRRKSWKKKRDGIWLRNLS